MSKFLIALMFAATLSSTIVAQDSAKILEVGPGVALSVGDTLVVIATGTVPDTGWQSEGDLVPYVYVRPPEDGAWDFDFIATRKEPGAYAQVVSPVRAQFVVSDFPDWVKKVRIHSAFNKQEYELISIKADANAKGSKESVSASLSIDVEYIRDGGQHCVVATAKGKLLGNGFELKLGKICVDSNRECVPVEIGVAGGFKFKGELCHRDGELCLRGKICKKYLGRDICTPEASGCVKVQ